MVRAAGIGSRYAELHLHTCYSFLEGASRPAELAARAARLGYRALAITDHDGLHGAMEFAQACASFGLQPITGVELTLRHGLHDSGLGPVHLTLLVESRRGYANLCRLITEAWRGTREWDTFLSFSPSLHPSVLPGHTEGLIALSGCRQGEVAQLVDVGRFQDALAAARRLAELFGPRNTFLELQHNLVQGDTRRVARLAELAEVLGLETVATGNVHYHERARHRLQDALVAVRHRVTLETSHRLRRPNSEFYLRSPQQMAEVFAAYPRALAATAAIAERCAAFNLAEPGQLGYAFPDFSRQAGEQHVSADEALAAYCWAKFKERYGTLEEHRPTASAAQGDSSTVGGPADPELIEKARAQLVEELRLVARHRLAGFFLLYRDLQELATEVAKEVRGAGTVRGGSGLPPGRGRGSSVSSIICYLIGLSHVDPVRNRLFFKRFLNEDLQTVPDIDLDFARDIREQLILRVYERYGHEHAALVCSFATYHLRSAVRDLGKALGLPPAALDKLARLSEGGGADTVRAELERLPELRGQARGPLWQHLAELAEQLNGFPRHVGQHVGGMVIASQPLVELVPIQPAAMPGRYVCQWDKDSCDDARFIKIDFLALGMLSLVEECLELIWQTHGEKVDLSALSYDDPAVYDAICAGDTLGMFQVESRAQIQMLPRTQPRTLDDLAVQVAIVRPGPIVGRAVNPYVRRREQQRRTRRGGPLCPPDGPVRPPRADHPLLDELLADTLGVVLYQDQVLEVAMAIGGFSAGQADRFRRAMSRRRSREAMEGFRASFLAGARRKGVDEREAAAIFDKLCAFSEFGFPKSHAYAFAVLAYQSAWLRTSYPTEYLAALLNNQPMGFYSPHVLVGDARRHGIRVLRPTLNRSGVKAVPLGAGGQGSDGPVLPGPEAAGGYVLLGLSSITGLGEDPARAIVAEREANGPYRSLPDLLRRVPLPRAVAERLIAVGALSEFGLSRRELLWQLGLLTRLGGQESEGRGRGTGPRPPRPRALDLGLWAPELIEPDMVRLPDMNDWERMVADYALLELSPGYHPLGMIRPTLPADIRTAAQLKGLWDGAPARTAGMVVCRQRPGTARGFVFLLLEDETGLTNVVVRPELYEAERSVVRGAPYLWVEGRVQLRSGSLNLLAERVAPLSAIPRRPPDPSPHRAAPRSHDRREALAHAGELELATPASHDFR